MTILGTLIAIVAAIILTIFLGPYGILVLISITFGLILSTHIRTKEIQSDLKIIKAKLGIEEKDEFNMTDQEIEEELEKEMLIDNDINELLESNRQIEYEIKGHIETDDKDSKKT